VGIYLPARAASPLTIDYSDVACVGDTSAGANAHHPCLAGRLPARFPTANPRRIGTASWSGAAKSTASADESGSDEISDFASCSIDQNAYFDWDRSATTRVEIGPEGGVIIHLSDNCSWCLCPTLAYRHRQKEATGICGYME